MKHHGDVQTEDHQRGSHRKIQNFRNAPCKERTNFGLGLGTRKILEKAYLAQYTDSNGRPLKDVVHAEEEGESSKSCNKLSASGCV